MTDQTDALDRTALETRGISGWAYGLEDRVRFYEIDLVRHVNNISFLRWFEVLRVRYFLDYGLSDYSHSDSDPQLVVRHQTTDFLAPMHMDQRYVVVGRITLLKPTSFVLAAAVFADGMLRAQGETVMISLEQDGKTRRPHKAEAVRKIIKCDAPEMQT
ncbi:MAG: acyl-CoA thioesterase [Silicimonas sp.]|nr:acyl-CoA thioesterase [Silicimonas sp.]